MTDSIQVLLTVVISVLTVLLTVISIAIFQILREFKGSLERMNKILDDTGRITESVAEPVEEASDFIMGLKKGVSFFKNISKFLKEDEREKKPKKLASSSTEDTGNGERVDREKKKRFFTRDGRALTHPS